MSRAWYAVIDSCEPYWKLQCIHSGVFQDLDLLQTEMVKFGSFKALFLALLKLKTRLKPELLTLEQIKLSNKQCSPLLNGFYYTCSSMVNASISVFKYRSRSSKRAASATIEDVFPHGYPSILWSSLSDNGVLLYTNNGNWLRFHFPSDESHVPSACGWEEENVRSFIYHIAGSCPKCCLVVIMGKRRNTESLWELEALQLERDIKV